MINFFAEIFEFLRSEWNSPYDRVLMRIIIGCLCFMAILLTFALIMAAIETKGMLLVFFAAIAGVITLFYHFLDFILGRKTEKDD